MGKSEAFKTVKFDTLTFWLGTLKMEAICSPETLVPTFQTRGCHNPEDYSMNRLSTFEIF
jgi:hypothetical protein